jgi:RHS repeat-associated protein
MTEQRNDSSSGQLLSRDETLYDNRGRVYRTIRYGVDPATGDITGDQIHDTTYDEAYNVLRQEPAGAMEFQTFEYDSLGRRVSVTNPLDEATLYSFDDAGNQISTTDPNEEVWTRDYDPLGRLIRSTNPLDESTTYGFNDAGVQTTVTNALSETTTSTFDDAGRLIAVSDPLGQVTTYAYDANGNQVSLTDPNNLTTISEYDFRDRLIKVTDPLDDSTQYAYNRVGELIVETDAKDHDTTHVYDSLGRKVSTTDRLDQTTSFAWNPLGMQASLTDAQNQTTGYQYDEFARLHLTIWPDHQNGTQPGDQNYGITKTEYDSLNRVLRTTDQLGDTITHVYDAAGRLLAKDYRTLANSPSGTIADSDTFTYEATGRMLTAVSGRYSNTVTLAYDAAGRKSTESLTISGQTYTSATEYDAVGRVSKLIYPDASEVTRTHTARGQLATLASDATTIDTRVYDNGGRMVSSSYNNGVSESRTYNDDNTLASIIYTGAAIGNLSYTWDANKNKMSETIGGVMSGYGFTAGYDADDRLVSWDRADSALDQSWNLSPVGNWNSFTENATTQVRTHSPANEILTAATEDVFHDPKGNTTLIPPVLRTSTDPLTIKWDFDNKLRAADTNDDNTDDIFYKWDALGRRVGRDDGTSNVIYFQDGQQTLADYTAGTSSASPTYKYVFASYIDEIVARIDSSDNILYFNRNQQYSITAVSDGGGSVVERYAYSAYGQVTIADASGSVISGSAIANRYTYTGREWDQGLSLYHYRARMFDAQSGRFTSRDRIGYAGSEWNLYEFLESKSLVLVDSLGEKATLTVTKLDENVRLTNLNPRCDVPIAYATFRFQLDEWPCRGNFGYFVQRVSVSCHVAPCRPTTDGGESDHFVYTEAWRVQRPLRGRTFVIDRAEFPSRGLGRYRQDGTVKFYCLSPDNEVKEGEISVNETSNPGANKFGVGGPCATGSGALHSTSDDQPYWGRTSAANSGHRTFGMNWNCCCDKSVKFANAFARP